MVGSKWNGLGATLETVCAGGVDGDVVMSRVDAIEGVMVPFGTHKVGKDPIGTVWYSMGPCGTVRTASLYIVAGWHP